MNPELQVLAEQIGVQIEGVAARLDAKIDGAVARLDEKIEIVRNDLLDQIHGVGAQLHTQILDSETHLAHQ